VQPECIVCSALFQEMQCLCRRCNQARMPAPKATRYAGAAVPQTYRKEGDSCILVRRVGAIHRREERRRARQRNRRGGDSHGLRQIAGYQPRRYLKIFSRLCKVAIAALQRGTVRIQPRWRGAAGIKEFTGATQPQHGATGALARRWRFWAVWVGKRNGCGAKWKR